MAFVIPAALFDFYELLSKKTNVVWNTVIIL